MIHFNIPSVNKIHFSIFIWIWRSVSVVSARQPPDSLIYRLIWVRVNERERFYMWSQKKGLVHKLAYFSHVLYIKVTIYPFLMFKAATTYHSF